MGKILDRERPARLVDYGMGLRTFVDQGICKGYGPPKVFYRLLISVYMYASPCTCTLNDVIVQWVCDTFAFILGMGYSSPQS